MPCALIFILPIAVSFAKKYPEKHLNQANCLILVVNAIAVWNTIYMQAAIQHL